ncbi:MAG: lipoyl synthase [Proteobacteria bacterium]|nr:lipoyl synthase [Pseudomonadota bacterium]
MPTEIQTREAQTREAQTSETQQGPSRDQRGKLKTAKIPIKVIPMQGRPARKPSWIRAKAPTGEKVTQLKSLLREQNLHTVCEEAACPNLGECFSHGTATFMIMGDVCTRRCPFCDVAHGRPKPLDLNEPEHLAQAIEKMQLKYVVITSVDRDDLKDGGAGHFSACIEAIRSRTPEVKIEILVPDFRRRMDIALSKLAECPPDVFNHNLETVKRLYRKARPGADYDWSLQLIKNFKAQHPELPGKSGLMLGLGETIDEVKQVLQDLRAHNCDMLTLGQYLQPSRYHLQVERFVTPDEFAELGVYAESLGFKNVASAPMVRSSYHADLQAAGRQF